MDIEKEMAGNRQVIKLKHIKYCILDMMPVLDVLQTDDGVVGLRFNSESPPYAQWTNIRELVRDLRKVMSYHLCEDDRLNGHFIRNDLFIKMMENVRQIDFFFTLPIDEPHVTNIFAGRLIPELKEAIIVIARYVEELLKDLEEEAEQSCT